MDEVVTERTLLLAAWRRAASGAYPDSARPALGSVVVLLAIGAIRLVEGKPEQMALIALVHLPVGVMIRQVKVMILVKFAALPMLVKFLLGKEQGVAAALWTVKKLVLAGREVVDLAALFAEGTLPVMQSSAADAAEELLTGTLALQQLVVVVEADAAL
jgi:hypothetical protein